MEPSIPHVQSIPQNTVGIFDTMVLLRKLPPGLQTFGEISSYILEKITKGTARIVFFVTDHYLPYSIKAMERERRSNSGTIRIAVLRRDQTEPKQFSKFLGSSENKSSLIKFLYDDWSTNNIHSRKLSDKELFMTIGNQAHCITSVRGGMKSVPVDELCSHQEEADTKMFLCASFASSLGIDNVKIDTDVFVLSLYYQPILNCSIYLEFGTGSNMKLYDIRESELERKITDALPSFHALTGCDSTSSFSGIGKAKAFEVLKSNESFIDAMAILGEEENVSLIVENAIQEYVCCLYGFKGQDDVAEVRYKIFTNGKKLPDPNRLPPTHDALILHLKRVNYQVLEWKRALDNQFQVPDPEGRGWLKENEKLRIHWTFKPYAPESIIEFVSCGCKKSR